MTYERIAGGRPDIRGIYTVDYLSVPDRVLLKVNKTKLIGIYPTISAAREVVNGLLTLNGCNEPYDTSFRFTETFTNTVATTIQNSQSGNSVGTMFSQVSTGGIVDTSNASYIELKTDAVGTFNSRARVINENEAFGVLDADVIKPPFFKTCIYKARVSVPVFDNALWNSNVVTLGFHGNHAGGAEPNKYNCEKGCIFTPNSSGNWRCRWFSTPTIDVAFNEVLFKDTNIPISTPANLQIILEDNGRTATWIINDKIQFSCSYTDSPQIANLPPDIVQAPISRLIYSVASDVDSEIVPTPTNKGYAIYVGAEVRRRTISSAQHSLRLFNQSLETIA